MAEDLLRIVIANFQSFVQQELATLWGVEKQIEKLSGYLTAIRAVLRDAEEKQITTHSVKDWLQKLTDAAYVLDDILDECSIQSNRLQCEAQNSGFAALSACLTPFHPKNILFRCDVGKRMKEITQRFHDINVERQMFGLHAGIIERQPEDDEWRQTSSAIREPKVYGRDQDRELIVEFLLRQASQNEDLPVYPIVGMGGRGKTTLAQQVFNDERVSKHFDLTIWVCVSDDFSVRRILQSIIESTSGQDTNLKTLEAIQKKVQEVLQSKRYLLVLDDVWNEDEAKWVELKQYMLHRARGTTGATVLLTTRLERVASIMGTRPPHNLTILSEDDSWSLFTHHAFGPNREWPTKLEEIGKEIVRKCAGSPLAIKALGSLLRFKSDEKQWHGVKESRLWDIPEDNSVMRALKLSYFNLKLSLRQCFSFCAIFPKDFQIVKEDLIHLWVANGFIKSRGNLEVEVVGNEAWKELYHRSFFQEVKNDVFGNIRSFKMHDLFHDLAQSVMGEECTVSKPTRLTNLSRRVHHIHFLRSDRLINVAAYKKVESLRTLLDCDSYRLRHELPSNGSLRALCMKSILQLSALKNLTHLRYLNLREGYFTSLPNSICELQKLQILKLENCEFLYWLPKDLTRLQDLRHLVIKGCGSLVAMPPKFGKLRCLRTLSTFIVGSKKGFGLAELHGLQLGGKLHIRGLENVPSEGDAKEANLVAKTDLNHLYLTWGWGSDANSQGSNDELERVLEALEPPSTLKSFGIKGYQGMQFPSWMRNTSVLKGLVDIILYNCKNCERLPPLGKLPHLKTLFICGMKDVKHVDRDSYDDVEEKAFPSLKYLTLTKLPNLESMIRDEGVEMLPCLSEIKISGVPEFKLPCLPSVEHLQTYGDEEVGIVSNMPGLKTLKIDLFYKPVLPDELGSLSALQVLELRNCHELESFPEHVLQGLTSLRTLEIGGCKLKSLSEGVGHLTCLEHLNLIGCRQLETLPSNMNQLTALRRVDMGCPSGRRVIQHLPEGLQRVPSLQSLSLWNVDSLPHWLGDMTSLQELHINSCPELRSLPSCLQRLTNLQTLDIFDCPKLEKRCKQGTGEDWPKIAHIPHLDLDSLTFTFGDRIPLSWKFLEFEISFAINRSRYGYDWSDGFDYKVDRT